MPTTYANYRPTGFDIKGLGLDDRQDWLVAPCGRNRDSEALDESNFAAMVTMLGGESDTVEVHRFGHWACGWYEICLVHPDRESDLDEIAGALENYPVLDDEDLSRREHEEYESAWDSWLWKDLARLIGRKFQLSIETQYRLDDIDVSAWRALYEDAMPSGDYWESNGMCSRLESAVSNIDRSGLAAWIRENRKGR